MKLFGSRTCYLYLIYLIKTLQIVKIFHKVFIIICFDFKKRNKEIATSRGEIIYLFFQDFIMQAKFLAKDLVNTLF